MDELDEIVPYIKENKCILFLGAGVSVLAGCSNWDSIPESLIAQPEMQQVITENPSLLPESSTTQQKIEILADELKKMNKDHVFDNVFRSALHCDPRSVIGAYSSLVRPIERIFSFGKILLTTNVDNCLEGTEYFSPSKNNPVYYSLDQFRVPSLDQGGIYCIHGNRDASKETIFTDSAYGVRYANVGFENFLCYILKNYNVLFIGYSFSDKPLMGLVESMRDRAHFALVRKGKYTAIEKTEFIEKYNIKLIEYPDHDSLPSLLQAWVDNNFPEISIGAPEEDVTHAV